MVMGGDECLYYSPLSCSFGSADLKFMLLSFFGHWVLLNKAGAQVSVSVGESTVPFSSSTYVPRFFLPYACEEA